MKLSGTATLHAPRERVWDALQDPEVLVRTIPGCSALEPVGEHAYRMTVSAGVASIKGTYLGDVRLTDQSPPASYVLRATGAGAPGTVEATARVTLTAGEQGTTELAYDADAVVGGPIGGVGQRVLGGVAKRLAAEFFSAVDRELIAGPQAAEAGVPAGPGVAVLRPGRPGPPADLRLVALGALIALGGVALGARIARRG